MQKREWSQNGRNREEVWILNELRNFPPKS